MSSSQDIANRFFATEASIDRALTEASKLLAETMTVSGSRENVPARLDDSIDGITQSIAALLQARRALETKPGNGSASAVPSDEKEPWRPNHWLASLAEIDVAGLDRKTFALELNGLFYACDLTVLPDADKLYVSLHPFADRMYNHPPFFWAERGIFDHGHVLRISDPTLFLNDQVTMSCFLGPERQDPIEGVVQIAQQVGRQFGLNDERIIYWGKSSGAVGALRAATLVPHGRAVGLNSLIDGRMFDDAPWAREVRETFRKDWSFADIYRAYPVRSSLAQSLHWALQRGHAPRLVLLQNDQDEMCYADQFVPFCKEFGLDPEKDCQTENLKTLMYSDPKGHNSVPGDAVDRVILEGIPFLMGEQTSEVRAPLNTSWFDEGYYLRNNPDVKAAIGKGLYKSALEHFQIKGADEKRRKRAIGRDNRIR
jgi:hypothetical protein